MHSLSVLGVLYFFSKQENFLDSMGTENGQEYFDIARGILEEKTIKTIRTIGYPLFLIPFMNLFKAIDMKQILLPVSLFNSLILYNISVILVAIITLRLTSNLNISCLAATLWTAFPGLVYLFARVNPGFDYPGLALSRLMCQMFMHVANDGFSTFFVLLTAFLSVIFLDNRKVLYSIILGLSFAISVLIRPQNIALLLVILPIFIYRKKLKNLFLFFIPVLLTYMPQFIYNWNTSDSLLNLKTLIESENITATMERGYAFSFYSLRSIPYILTRIWEKYPLYILVTLGLIGIIVIATLIGLFVKKRLSFYILSSWILSYLIIYGLYYDTANDLLRFMMPIIPALLIVISISVFRVISTLLKVKI